MTPSLGVNDTSLKMSVCSLMKFSVCQTSDLLCWHHEASDQRSGDQWDIISL